MRCGDEAKGCFKRNISTMIKKKGNVESRRDFIRKAVLAGSLIPLIQDNVHAGTRQKPLAASPLKVHVFSKHLQFLNYQDMAAAARDIGFDGVDLAVRPKGHVLPERVETDLPKAVEAIRKAGLSHTHAERGHATHFLVPVRQAWFIPVGNHTIKILDIVFRGIEKPRGIVDAHQ